MSKRMLVCWATVALAVLLSETMYGQGTGCQDQACAKPASTGARCWTCVSGLTLYCSTFKARCPIECTTGSCYPELKQGELSQGEACNSPAKVSLTAKMSDDVPMAAGADAQEEQNSAPPQTTTAYTLMMMKASADDPVTLLGVTHNMDSDLFIRGVAKNQGQAVLKSYRIGYFIYPQDESKPVVEKTGPVMNVPEGVQPGATFPVQGQGVSPSSSDNARLVVFFIANAKFDDGSDWKASAEDIKAKYANQNKQQ